MSKKTRESKSKVGAKPKTSVEISSTQYAGKWLYAFIPALIILVYGRTYFFGLTPTDDQWLIVTKTEILNDIRNLPGLFTENIYGLFYRPLFNVSFMLDQQIGGTASAFHATNILLHIVCCYLLYRFLVLINTPQRIAVFLVLIFAMHPLNVQSVTWIQGRNDTLLALFVLLSCNTLLRFWKTNEPVLLLLHVIFSCAALLTKETAFALPVIIVALVFLHAKELQVRQKVLLGTMWLLMIVLRIGLQVKLVPYTSHTADFAAAVAQFFQAMCMSTSKIVVPAGLSMYPLTENASILFSIAVLLLCLAASWKYGLNNKALAFFALFWMVAFSFLPTWFGAYANPPVYYENRMYLPLMGGLLFLSQLRIPVSPQLLRTAIIVLLIVFACITFRRESVYADEFTYAIAATEEAPQISFFHDIVGMKLREQGNHQEAIGYFNAAIERDPSIAEYYNHRGITWHTLHQYRNALSDYSHVLQLDPSQKETFVNRSISYYSVGDYDAALHDLEHADSLGAAIDPKYVEALNKALRTPSGSAVGQ